MISAYKRSAEAIQVYTQPSVRSDQDWTPARLRSAMVMADSGRYRMAADLCEAIMADDRAGADLLKRVRSISGIMPVFQSSGDGRKSGTLVKELGSLRDGGGGDWWKMLPEAEYGDVKMWGIVLGFGIGQLIWKKHRGRDLPCIDPWHPRHIRVDDETRRYMIQVRKGKSVDEVVVNEGVGEWFIYTPYGKTRPHSRGLWRGLSPWWLLKRFAIGDWGRHSENASTMVGSSPKGATKEHRQELASNLYSMAKNAVVVLPPEFDLKLVEATANTRDIYDAQIQAADLAMTIAITGVNLPTHATGGSYAAMTEQSSVATTVRMADAEIDSTQTREQIICHWAEKNHGNPELAPWPHWDVRRPEEKLALADAMAKLGTALTALKTASPKVDVETLLEDAGIPMMTEAEMAKADEKSKERREKMGLVQPPQAPGAVPPKPGEKTDDKTADDQADDKKPPTSPEKLNALLDGVPAGQTKLDQERFMEEISDEAIASLVQDLKPFIDDLLARVDEAETIEEIKTAILDAFDDDDTPQAVETLERAMLLAHLAGVAAVMEGE